MKSTLNVAGIAQDIAFGTYENKLALANEIAAWITRTWNARGTADIATLESSLISEMGVPAAAPFLKKLRREISKLDR